MATENPILCKTFVAENAITQFYGVEVGGAADQVDMADGAGDLCIGIAQEGVAAGDGVSVMLLGVTKAVASAAIVAGARVGVAAGGKMVTKSSDADLTCGIALTAAAADGDVFSVFLTPGAQRAA